MKNLLPETFCDFLRARGVNVPKQTVAKPYWMYTIEQKAFRICWEAPYKSYKEMSRNYRKKLNESARYDEELKKAGYDVQMPEIPMDFQIPKNPLRAAQLFKEQAALLEAYDTNKIYRELRNQLHEAWVDKIIHDIPADCSLVIIKNKVLVASDEAVSAFEDSVAKGREYCLFGMFGLPKWTAMYPNRDNLREALLSITYSGPANYTIKYNHA